MVSICSLYASIWSCLIRYALVYVFRSDAVSVQIVVNAWKTRGDESPVRYYKKVGESNEHTKENADSPFTKEDFLLVFQSEQQAEMMADNPRILCVDATHGLTGYDYYLLTMMVVDEHGHGLPVSWAITSRENGFVWKLFGQSLRPKSLASKPEVLMADDANASWNGLTCVWSSLKYKLLCHWHVKKNVRQHCFGTKSKIQVLCVSHMLLICLFMSHRYALYACICFPYACICCDTFTYAGFKYDPYASHMLLICF